MAHLVRFDNQNVPNAWPHRKGRDCGYVRSIVAHFTRFNKRISVVFVCLILLLTSRQQKGKHRYSPAMWAIFPIQDLLAMDDKLRRSEDPMYADAAVQAIAKAAGFQNQPLL